MAGAGTLPSGPGWDARTLVIQKLGVEQGWISVSELEASARAPCGRERRKGHLPS